MRKYLSTLLQKRELSVWREEEEKTREAFERLLQLKESAKTQKNIKTVLMILKKKTGPSKRVILRS